MSRFRTPLRFLLAGGALAVAAFALQACATLSKEQCNAGDWAGIGRVDGGNGEPFDRVAEHEKACGRYGIAVDRAAYAAGREEGLTRFCRPERGFTLALAGETYRAVCPPALEGPFLAGYDIARPAGLAREDARRARAEVDRLRNELRELERELDGIDVLIRSAVEGERSDLDRRRARLQARRLDLGFELLRAEVDADRAEGRARGLEAEARARFMSSFGRPAA